MSGTIDFLESLGRSADARPLAEAYPLERLSDAERIAVASRDRGALMALVGARAAMACLIIAPDNDPMPDEQPVQPDETPEDGQQQAA